MCGSPVGPGPKVQRVLRVVPISWVTLADAGARPSSAVAAVEFTRDVSKRLDVRVVPACSQQRSTVRAAATATAQADRLLHSQVKFVVCCQAGLPYR